MAEKLITSSALRQSATNINGINTSFLNIMKEIQSTMQNMKKEWESEAATDFITQFNKIEVNIQSYSKVIKDYADYLTTAAQQFDDSDKRVDTNTQSLGTSNLHS